MPCLFALFAVFTPRLADLILWIARPTLFTAPFHGGWFLPLLGIIFLPFTTLMYVLLWNPGVGLVGWDWLWLILAVMCDLMHYGGSVYSNRNQIPGYTASTPTGPSVPGPSGS
jgi:hypothetical protein